MNHLAAILHQIGRRAASEGEAFNAPARLDPVYLAGERKQLTWQQREFSLFIKGDFKVSKNLTLNLGIRYNRYGVPFEANGKTAGLVGGSSSIFGISGTSFADLYRPGQRLNKPTYRHRAGRQELLRTQTQTVLPTRFEFKL